MNGSAGQPTIDIHVVEKDGDVFELLIVAGSVRLEVITELILVSGSLIARGLHVFGQGPGSATPQVLRAAARQLGRQWGANEIIIEGGVRTTGANRGHTPRRIVIPV